MEKNDVSKPITTTLIGSNYNLKVLSMTSFLIGWKLLHVINGDIFKFVQEKDKTNTRFVKRFED